jgi:inhibitor of cysteine peptidase
MKYARLIIQTGILFYLIFVSIFKSNGMKCSFNFSRILMVFVVISLPLQYACKEKLVRYEESGETFHIQIDDIIKLQLPGDPTTGNAWRKIFYNDSVLSRVGKKDYKIGDEVTGDGGMYYYRFRAIAPGTSHLKMEYGNRFDSKKKTIKTFEITVIVENQEKNSDSKTQDKDKPYE